MDLHLRLDGRHDLTGQIYAQLRLAVLEGRLQAGEQVPPSRELARRLSVSRTTAITAYDRLTGEGFLTATPGAGTFVTQDVRPIDPSATPASAVRAQPAWDDVALPSAFDEPAELDLRSGLPDLARFPYESWRRLLAHEHRPGGASSEPYGHPAGNLALREAIARHLATSRAVVTTADDIVVTQGLQQGVDVVARAVLNAGATVAVEDPGYGPPRVLLRSLGHHVVGVPVDHEGLVVQALPDDATLVYVTPAHQHPLGMTMSLRRRMELLDWAERHDAVIVEDDYDSEFRYGGRPIDALRGMDTTGRVIFAGSFSKTMLPSLRLGFVVVPPALRRAVQAAKYVTDWYSPAAPQAALARFFERGWYARHLRRMRTLYQARHELVVEILTTAFAGQLEVLPSQAGLHVAALAAGCSADDCRDIMRAAEARGVRVFTLRPHAFTQPPPAGFVIGYGAIDVEHIDQALERFRACFDTRR